MGDAFHISRILIQFFKMTVFFVIYTYSELSGSMSHVYSFLHYMLFSVKKCLYLACKLVLEIIRKLQTRMPQLTIHQYTKTKAATIFCDAIKINLFSQKNKDKYNEVT